MFVCFLLRIYQGIISDKYQLWAFFFQVNPNAPGLFYWSIKFNVKFFVLIPQTHQAQFNVHVRGWWQNESTIFLTGIKIYVTTFCLESRHKVITKLNCFDTLPLNTHSNCLTDIWAVYIFTIYLLYSILIFLCFTLFSIFVKISSLSKSS